MSITIEKLNDQEELFARAFAEPDISRVRSLYHKDVLYLSPTVRLYDWPRRIEGVDKTLEFIGLTVEHCPSISYRAVESACLPDGTSSFARIHFDWDHEGQRLRSNYVVLYRYRDGLIAQQELYYDPSGSIERLSRG
jgi:ketosteroid isomerase-like protein